MTKYFVLLRQEDENIGNDNEGVVSDENGNGANEEKDKAITTVQQTRPQRRKKLRVSIQVYMHKGVCNHVLH